MGSLQGFIDFKRKDFACKSIEDRLQNYNEFLFTQNDVEMKKQAARCMDCETPFCYGLGCPASNLIPEWNDYVLRNDIEGAYESLTSTNNFPEITGRICPALCENSCSLSINLAPVTIKQLELFIIEKAFTLGLVKPVLPKHLKSKNIAVIGSGPSGLAAAQELRRRGYGVTVYEKSDKIGGLLRYGIPDFKLPKWILDRRIELMQKEGIEFKTNQVVGKDVTIQHLKQEFDSILFCIGAGVPRDLQIKGRELEGIHFALEYLTLSNKFVANKHSNNEIINAKGKSVLVIGGGDTGSDCIGTANRQGAKKITQIEILPKPKVWEKSYNPSWPDYPNILRTSSSHKEGCVREFGVSTISFVSNGGHVEAACCKRVEWIKDESGRLVPKEIEDSEFRIEADLVFLSMGFLHAEHSKLLMELGVEYDPRGNIRTNANYETNISGIFAAGDAASGASLVVRAIYHGRQAAKSIDEFLC